MTNNYSVVSKSKGYAVKNFNNEFASNKENLNKACRFAAICNKNNHCNDFIVCIYEGGMFQEI